METQSTQQALTDIQNALATQRNYFLSGATLTLENRLESLESLYNSIRCYEKDIFAALKNDLGRPEFETYATDIGPVLEEISLTRKKLKSWMRPKRIKTPLSAFPACSKLYSEPFGNVLVLSPWNFPIQLSLIPLLSALSAGNCVILKPSRTSPASSEVIEKIVRKALPAEIALVIEGHDDTATQLLEQHFDFIFYTGSGRVGRIVMEAASKHLTPVCLEFGGKSPVLIAADADLDLAAKRVAWAKQLNAGQICVAPDYVLLPRELQELFQKKVEKWVTIFLGSSPLENNDYCKIISPKAFERLLGIAEGKAVYNREKLKIAPLVLPNSTEQSPAMQDEIFGPILPLIPYDNFDEAINFIRGRDKPLALYLFTKNKEVVSQVLEKVSFGGGCINDTIMHVGSAHLPFGGVGPSGMGAYHGKTGFDLFSHKKGIMNSGFIDMPLRYPPYKKNLLNMIKRVMK